jgi:hypothetical protein
LARLESGKLRGIQYPGMCTGRLPEPDYSLLSFSRGAKSTQRKRKFSTQKPFAKIRFAYEIGDHAAYLYIKNDGIIGDFFAQLRVSGERADVHARWAHTNDVRTRIPTGIERKLLLAKLHYSRELTPFSQWEIFYTSDSAIGSHMATYSSMVGNRDAQAPDINLEVVVASDPDMRGGVQSRKIVLHSNRAEEL